MTEIPFFDGTGPVTAFISAIDSLKLDDATKLRLSSKRLSENVRGCIDSVRRSLRDRLEKDVAWTWHLQKLTLTLIEAQVSQPTAKNDTRYGVAAKVATGIGIAAATCVAGPIVFGGLLGALGFSATGVVGGSIAAGIQSAVYGAAVPAGSLFAFAQSAAAGGAAVATVTSVSAIGGAAAGIGTAAAMESSDEEVSRSWDAGNNFRPSQELLDRLM